MVLVGVMLHIDEIHCLGMVSLVATRLRDYVVELCYRLSNTIIPGIVLQLW